MITAIFFKDSSGICKGFSIAGHAGYAESGSDIICASVSALAINTANSIEAFTKDPVTVNVDENGLLTLRFDEDVCNNSKLLIDSLILGLKGIANDYNNEDTYLKILFKEV